MMKRFILLFVTVLCLTFPGIVQAEGYRTSVGSGTDQIPLVVVKGTPYEMGKRLGELMKKESTELTKTYLTIIQGSDSKRFSNENLDKAWKSIAPHTDNRFKEELRGLAEGTGIPLKTLIRSHVVPVVADFSCSSVAAWGSATKNGHLYQTRNLDWDMNVQVQKYPLIVIYIPDEGVPHVNITFAGYIGSHTAMNTEGIVLTSMGDSPGEDYPFNLNGAHFSTFFRKMMYDARDLDQTITLFKNTKRIKKYHYVIGDGKNGRAVKMKAHAPNLIIWKDNDPTDEFAPKVFKNVVYNDEGRGAYEPIKKAYGKIDEQSMIDCACKIPIKGANLVDVVYDATALEFWVSFAKNQEEAYKRPFIHVKMKDYIK
jgi:isopenicillin-N N-acyltransferase like protein